MNIARHLMLAAALSLGATASAHAAEFSCSARIGPASNPNSGGTMLGSIRADNISAAEAQYQARISISALPLRTGRWVIHAVRCTPSR